MADSTESGSTTPSTGCFTSQGYTAEDILKQQTVGLVNLSDFRKRRAEAIEQTERGSSRDGTPGVESASDGREPATKTATAAFKKRKKGVKKGGLSFGTEEEEDDGPVSTITTQSEEGSTPATDSEETTEASLKLKKKGLRPNATVGFQPKALTKAAVMRDAQVKEQLRKEYIALQDAVKATDFCLPFVFFDGKNAPGGVCRMKKGDFIWLFLERARKLGAGMAHKSRRDWARIGVDDLMVVRGDLIIPHHYEFHYFILNRSTGYNDKVIFSYAAEPTAATPEDMLPASKADTASESTSTRSAQNDQTADQTSKYLQTASERAAAAAAQPPAIPDSELEGYNDEPSLTKVVDRRWYEKNKHIFPASLWEEFDANKDYSQGPRTDVQGNAFFFSRR